MSHEETIGDCPTGQGPSRRIRMYQGCIVGELCSLFLTCVNFDLFQFIYHVRMFMYLILKNRSFYGVKQNRKLSSMLDLRVDYIYCT